MRESGDARRSAALTGDLRAPVARCAGTRRTSFGWRGRKGRRGCSSRWWPTTTGATSVGTTTSRNVTATTRCTRGTTTTARLLRRRADGRTMSWRRRAWTRSSRDRETTTGTRPDSGPTTRGNGRWTRRCTTGTRRRSGRSATGASRTSRTTRSTWTSRRTPQDPPPAPVTTTASRPR